MVSEPRLQAQCQRWIVAGRKTRARGSVCWLATSALLFLAFWDGQAGLVFALLGIETKGRSIEEIGSALDARALAGRPAVRVPAT